MEFFDFANVIQSLVAVITDDPYYTYYWACLIVGAVAYLVFYSLEAVALYTIAKNNGYKNKWMAFVPFFNTYYIGALSKKNKTFGTQTKYFSLAMALLEFVCVGLGVLNAVAIMLLFEGNYVNAVPEPFYNTSGEIVAHVFTGKYEVLDSLPASLNWAWWVFNYMSSYILNTLDLAYLVLSVFVLSAFFRSYSPRNYMIFTIFSIIFPIKAIFMICLKNNRETNYVEYMRERQKRQYDAYQAYMRNMNNGNYNGGYGNPNGNNGNYNGGNPQSGSAPEDPFGGLGAQSGNNNSTPPEDPFDDIK